MQATKQRSGKKNSNSSETNNSDSPLSKSLAQRVMDVASNTSTTKSGSMNSIENDLEVEDITNRAAKLEVQVVETNNNNLKQAPLGEQMSSESLKTTPTPTTKTTKCSESSSPSLLLDDSRPTNSNSAHSFSSIPMTMPNLVSSDSVFRQILANNFHPKDEGASSRNASKSNLETETQISLDTQVPHPSRSDFKQKEEEVSYCNDQAASSFSLDTKTSGQNRVLPKPIVTNDQKLTLNAQTSSGGSFSKLPPQPNSREYLNQVDENDVDDEYETRYHYPTVEEMADLRYHQHQHSGTLSTPNSPKAKSAPTTPCNVTPITFHQHKSHINSITNPSPANTLPCDIRKTATSRVLPSSMGDRYLDELIKRGDILLESKDFIGAVRFYSQCIELAANSQNFQFLKENFKVYSQRAEAHFNLGNYNEAIDDSIAARELSPKWTQAYYRQGRCQLLIGQYADSLAVFSYGLAQDPSSKKLFDALVDAALKSVFKTEFEPKYNKLKSIELDKKPFVVVSVLGQELLAKGHGEHAAIILESALKMGAEHNKLKGSVLSTLGYAYCMMKDYEKAVFYMQEELDVESELEDVSGQCRVLSNLGYTYYKMRKFDKSLESHRKQLTLAMRTHLFQQASIALNAIGHVHVARNDYTSALTSHTRCLEILKQLGDNDYSQYKELLSIGFTHSMLGDYKSAEEKYNEAIQMLESSRKLNPEEYHTGLVMVNFNLAYLALKKQSFHDAKQYYASVLKIAENVSNPKRIVFEMRASNGMGQAHRLFKKFDEARIWFENQLQLAQKLNDRAGQSQALCNLGMTYQHFRDYSHARKLFDENLRLVDKDPLLKAYAHSYMGSMHFLMNRFNEAQGHYETSLKGFKELDYCSAEKKTIDLNMAAVLERMGHPEVNMSQQRKALIT